MTYGQLRRYRCSKATFVHHRDYELSYQSRNFTPFNLLTDFELQISVTGHIYDKIDMLSTSLTPAQTMGILSILNQLKPFHSEGFFVNMSLSFLSLTTFIFGQLVYALLLLEGSSY